VVPGFCVAYASIDQGNVTKQGTAINISKTAPAQPADSRGRPAATSRRQGSHRLLTAASAIDAEYRSQSRD